MKINVLLLTAGLLSILAGTMLATHGVLADQRAPQVVTVPGHNLARR